MIDPRRLKAAIEALMSAKKRGDRYPLASAARETETNNATMRGWKFEGRLEIPSVKDMKAAAETWAVHHDYEIAARELNMSVDLYTAWLHMAAERGHCGTDPVLPGFEITSTSTTRGKDGVTRTETIKTKRSAGELDDYRVQDGFRMRKATLQVAGGKIERMWPRIVEDEWSLERTIEVLKGAFVDFEGIAAPTPPPAHAPAEILNLVPLNDIHAGMFSWARETGVNWDLKSCERVIGSSIVDLFGRLPLADVGVVLGGGDLTHADNNNNTTARSGNKLDVDGRHQKIVETACRLVVLAIDEALKRHCRVVVRILPGNHDDETSVAIAWFLHAWYRNEPRVELDLDQSLFWVMVHGQVMLAATHGHEVKIQDMPGIMAGYWPKEWGATLFRYAHGFHVHHRSGGKTSDTLNSVVWETHEAPIPPDNFHHGAGFGDSPRSIQGISYHMTRGEMGRARSSIYIPREEAA